ncbi:MAG: hypothetical protein ITG00_00195 [Flavobacterium sp.]|nr:hypothetical protein [Flavobacterium sp.]
MKNSILFLLFVMAFGCQSYRDFTNQTYHYNILGKDTLHEGRYVYGSVDNLPIRLLFDTGANITALYGNKIGEGDSLFNNNRFKLDAVTGWQHTTSVKKIISDSISFQTFSSQLQPFILNDGNFSQSQCVPAIQSQGLLGLDAFQGSKDKLHLNYNENVLEWFADVVPSAYQPVDAKFTRQGIFIKIKINDVYDYFLFDSGADVSLLVKDKFQTEPVAIFETYFSTFQNKEVFLSSTAYHYFAETEFCSIKIPNIIITKTENIDRNILGFLFIKSFNWLIDFKNKRLYAKEINNTYLTNLRTVINETHPKVLEMEGKLKIAFKRQEDENYELGQQIISVNDELIDETNICFWQNELNNVDNWERFKIRFAE